MVYKIFLFQSPSHRGAARGKLREIATEREPIDFSPLLIGEPRAADARPAVRRRENAFQSPSHRGAARGDARWPPRSVACRISVPFSSGSRARRSIRLEEATA